MPETVTSPEGQPLRVDVTMDEMEAGVKAADDAAKAAADAATAEAAKIKAGEASEDPKVSALREALRLSEESRSRLETTLHSGRDTAPPPPPAPKELSREELAELHTKDPLAAIEYMQALAVRTVEENLSRRLTPLMSGNSSTLEDQMKSKYPDEFKVFGPEITDFVKKAADKSTFSVASNWEDLIAWTRGKNYKKLVAYQAEQANLKATEDAQALERANAGTHVRSTGRTPPPPKSDGGFDDTTKAIIKELAASGVLDDKDPEADYRRWLNVGR